MKRKAWAPEFLEGRARLEWDRMAPPAAAPGRESAALSRYCVLTAIWLEALAFVRKNGTTYPVRGEPERGRPGRILHFREWPQSMQLRSINQQLLAIERGIWAPPRKSAGGEAPGLFG